MASRRRNGFASELSKIAEESDGMTFGKVMKHVVLPGVAAGAGAALGSWGGRYLAEKLMWPPTSGKAKMLQIGIPILLGTSGLLATILAQRQAQHLQKAMKRDDK